MTTKVMSKMTKSKKFKTVKSHFDGGFWTVKMVRNAVKQGWISEEEFAEITKEQY